LRYWMSFASRVDSSSAMGVLRFVPGSARKFPLWPFSSARAPAERPPGAFLITLRA
jgi:hypothetical protein